MERETGIEHATNSLEGCDTTTELLPQLPALTMVAREGFEPSKPLGRQIYSLLRLTASLPRRVACAYVPPLRPTPFSHPRGDDVVRPRSSLRPSGSACRARHRSRQSGTCRGCAFRHHQKTGGAGEGI